MLSIEKKEDRSNIDKKLKNNFDKIILSKCGHIKYRRYFQEMRYKAMPGKILVAVVNQFFNKDITEYQSTILNQVIETLWPNQSITLKFEIKSSFNNNQMLDFNREDENLQSNETVLQFMDGFTFENFFESNTNILASKIAKSIACYSSEQIIQPSSLVYIHGSGSNGKTHISKAIYQSYKEKGGKIFFADSRKFMEQYVDSVKANDILSFKKKIASHDIIIVDNVDKIIDKNKTSATLLEIASRAMDDGAIVIFTSKLHPVKLVEIASNFSELISSSVVVKIQNPDNNILKKIIINDSEKLNSSSNFSCLAAIKAFDNLKLTDKLDTKTLKSIISKMILYSKSNPHINMTSNIITALFYNSSSSKASTSDANLKMTITKLKYSIYSFFNSIQSMPEIQSKTLSKVMLIYFLKNDFSLTTSDVRSIANISTEKINNIYKKISNLVLHENPEIKEYTQSIRSLINY